MRLVQRDWRKAVRLLSAVALILLAFAHKPVVVAQYSPAELAAFALPDGSLPVLCLPSGAEHDDGKYAHDAPCDACRISSASLLAVPECDFGPRLLAAHFSLPLPDVPLLRHEAFPPAAPPQAPPIV